MTAFDRAAAATFLNATLGDAEGFAALAFGHEGYFNERGRYSHKEWTETSYAWPSEGERLLDDVARELLSGQRVDVYVCPYVRATGQRKKGEAVSRRLIHADRDGTEPLGEDLLTELGVSAVDSGSPGHEHVYLSLADDLDPAPHELLCRALAAKVGQADPKFSDNDVLRLPGAWNFKHDPPRPVRWIREPGIVRPSAAYVVSLLGVDLAATPPPSRNGRGTAAAAGRVTEVEDEERLPTRVREALDEDTGDRSVDTFRIVAACLDAGLTLPQARGVVNLRADLRERLAERQDDDVQASWLAAIDSRQVEYTDVSDLVGAAADGPKPDAEPVQRAVVSTERYFGKKGGLRAATLLRDVEHLGPLAGGIDGAAWAFRDGVWRPDGDREIRARVVGLLREQYRRAHADTVVDMLKARPPFIGDDPVVHLLNVPNGLLDWSTGELRPHDPKLPTTVRIPVPWNPNATCPAVDAFLASTLPADCIPLAEEIAGYALLADNPLHKAILCDGAGRNGKGAFLRLLKALLGEENVVAVPPQRLDTDRFAVAQLYRRLGNLVGDVDPRTFKETATFKQVTGGDLVYGEHKYCKAFGFTARVLIVAAFNSLPRSADTTEGFFSRWIVLPFPHRFAVPDAHENLPPGHRIADPDLTRKLTAPGELEGFLVRAVAGLRRVMETGRFTRPPTVAEAEDRFRRHADPVRGFLAERVIPDPYHGWVDRADLHHAYRAWAQEAGVAALPAQRFNEKLDEVHVELFGVPRTAATRRGRRGWAGIRLRTDADEAEEGDRGDEGDGSASFPPARAGGRASGDVTFVTPVTPAAGPCTGCGVTCPRYGPGGSPLCAACATLAGNGAGVDHRTEKEPT
jgi:P4 family phage/plasmid primase-like protien